MKRNFATTRIALFALAAATTVACATTDGSEGDGSFDENVAELEAAQEQLGDMDDAAPGCLPELTACLADGGEDCLPAFAECLPKPPKADDLKQAAAICKAKKEALQGTPPEGAPGGGRR